MTRSLPDDYAVLVRNRFQFRHLVHLIDQMEISIVCRPKLAKALAAEHPDMEFVSWRGPWFKLDGRYRVIIAQGSFAGREFMSKTKLAMIQYGYAKAPYNFGAMRAMADLNLAYGPYAAERFSKFAPAVSVGHPGIEAAKNETSEKETLAFLKETFVEDRPLLLYVPTWGALSSLPEWLERVATLGEKYNVLVKPHHNSFLQMAAKIEQLKSETVAVISKGPDLLPLALASDVVISDQSGAIFDGILAEKPVVLLECSKIQAAGSKKQDAFSLEVNNPNDLGIVVRSEIELSSAIEKCLESPLEYSPIANDLFEPAEGSIDRAMDALLCLRDGGYKPNQMQTYAMASVQSSARQISKLRIWLVCMTSVAALLAIMSLGNAF